MVGGAMRLAIDVAVPAGPAAMPWDIVAVNVVGSAALGWLDGRTLARGDVWWQPLVGTGVLGGFTTFSSIAALTWTATDAPAWLTFALLAGTVVATVAVAIVARRAGLRWARL